MLKIKVDKVLGDAREDDSAMNERGNGMQYAVGAEVAIPGDMRHYLRCTTAGTTGATVPEVPADFQSGVTTIQDGTVVWTVYGYMIGNDAAPYVYGIDYDTTIATASSACKKIVLAADGSYTPVDDFMQLPAHNFRRCVMSNLANRTIAYYLHPDDSSKKLDGTTADLTGADGDVMVEIPITHWRIDHYTDANSHAHTVWLVSNQAFTNSAPPPFFYVSPGGATLRTQYVGAFHSVICDSDGAPLTTSLEASASAAYVAGRKARSVIGAKPFTGMTQATHRTAAANNGGYGINSLFKQFLLLMMAIEGGSFDTQTTISEGFLFAKEWDYRYTRLSGRTVSMGNRTGSVFYYTVLVDAKVYEDSDFGTNGKLLVDKYTINDKLASTTIGKDLTAINTEVVFGKDNIEVSHHEDITDMTYTSFVGLGDQYDYAEVVLNGTGKVTLHVDTFGTASTTSKFTLYKLELQKNGSWKKTTVGKTMSVKTGKNGVGLGNKAGLSITKATSDTVKYFVGIEAGNASKGSEVWYNLSASFDGATSSSALDMPQDALTMSRA